MGGCGRVCRLCCCCLLLVVHCITMHRTVAHPGSSSSRSTRRELVTHATAQNKNLTAVRFLGSTVLAVCPHKHAPSAITAASIDWLQSFRAVPLPCKLLIADLAFLQKQPEWREQRHIYTPNRLLEHSRISSSHG